jgi:hypothetical protein
MRVLTPAQNTMNGSEEGTMGFEVELNAFPPQCELLERVRAGEISAELIQFVGWYFVKRRTSATRWTGFARGDPERERFVDSLEKILAEHPGIAERSCDLDRRFEWLEWLLVRCVRTEDDRSLAVAAIRGDAQILPGAVSTQGFPIRRTLPDRCVLIHRWLEALTIRDPRAHYNPVAMERDHLYKWSVPPHDPDEVFGQIAEDFAALQRLYREVAACSEAVLVTKD